ncbi:hypothetical protein C8R45DRAFT_1213766 [Mycena sanguinolenta]|nr:hypothetical protein C8R45DRAFT_1213766 [Mycena sanguinolenta]
MNPFAQGGWSSSSDPNPSGTSNWGTTPSVFGALPYTSSPVVAPELSFTFSPVDGTILNSLVIGPKSRTYFRISTDSGFTVVQNAKLQNTAIVEWRSQPMVEINDIVSKRSTSQWLALSPDKTHRIMSARGKSFRWAPSEGYIELYSTGVPNPRLFGRILQSQNGVKLELTTEAVHVGLLEVCVTSTVLLMSGRNIG